MTTAELAAALRAQADATKCGAELGQVCSESLLRWAAEVAEAGHRDWCDADDEDRETWGACVCGYTDRFASLERAMGGGK